eukprot:00417_3
MGHASFMNQGLTAQGSIGGIADASQYQYMSADKKQLASNPAYARQLGAQQWESDPWKRDGRFDPDYTKLAGRDVMLPQDYSNYVYNAAQVSDGSLRSGLGRRLSNR